MSSHSVIMAHRKNTADIAGNQTAMLDKRRANGISFHCLDFNIIRVFVGAFLNLLVVREVAYEKGCRERTGGCRSGYPGRAG
jgi:hypothetical protein